MTRNRSHVQVLASVGRFLLEATELEDQLGLTLRLATEALGASRGSVMMVDIQGGGLNVKASLGLPAKARERTVELGEGIAGWVAVHNEPVILHGGVADKRFTGVDSRIESSISLPLSVKGRVLGVLNISRPSGEKFTADDLHLAESLADMAALAIEKAALYSALREREERVSDLLAMVINAQEKERRRIAADIHDGFLQDLSAVFLAAESAKMQLDRGNLHNTSEAIAQIQEMIRDEVRAVREYIFEVRPPSLDQVGLGPTVRAMVDRLTGSGITGDFEHEGATRRPSETIETIVYRVAQEALRNAVKHSSASNVSVRLDQGPNEIRLIVRDDGKGIELAESKRGHFGIETMRERVELAGGGFYISKLPEGGTQVEAVIPLDSTPQTL